MRNEKEIRSYIDDLELIIKKTEEDPDFKHPIGRLMMIDSINRLHGMVCMLRWSLGEHVPEADTAVEHTATQAAQLRAGKTTDQLTNEWVQKMKGRGRL
jgi:hypothetical protein